VGIIVEVGVVVGTGVRVGEGVLGGYGVLLGSTVWVAEEVTMACVGSTVALLHPINTKIRITPSDNPASMLIDTDFLPINQLFDDGMMCIYNYTHTIGRSFIKRQYFSDIQICKNCCMISTFSVIQVLSTKKPLAG